jgi:hypothetical protein
MAMRLNPSRSDGFQPNRPLAGKWRRIGHRTLNFQNVPTADSSTKAGTYRYEHFQIVIAHSNIPGAVKALQSAAAKATTDAATHDCIQLYEGEAEQLT